MPFRIAYTDITTLKADAIVNPTDRFYSGGGGVDWLIHSICGPQLYEATRKLPLLHLGIEETEEMLMKAGYAFNPSSMQDIIVSGLIREGIYDRYQIDDLLYALDLQQLPGAV